ncbi:hypothetical protein M1O51_02065 [Dehalococcoidia bacterium]|nr:hypothetical protein [Dehalococcoidia bacterium]
MHPLRESGLLHYLPRDIFAGTPLARMGIREFVEQAMRVPARAEFLGMDTFITVFPETSLYAQALVQAIERKSSAQLALPFTEPEMNKRVISFS